MNKSELKAIFINAKATDAKYIGVSIQTEGSSQPEIIINPNPNFDAKFDYYMEAYDDDLILIAAKGKKDIRITAAGQGNRFEDIECQLLGERGKGWKELIAGAIDNAYEKMIENTPPTTEEERTHCEMIKEAVKGMFINESRTAAEAEFIKTHIVDYEKIFDVCMLCSGKMTDREKEAFIGGIEFARDWNLDIPPDDLRLYERLIQERTKKENEQSHIDG
jgi:hypothetical protein